MFFQKYNRDYHGAEEPYDDFDVMYLNKLTQLKNHLTEIYNKYYLKNYELTADIMDIIINKDKRLKEMYSCVFENYKTHDKFREMVELFEIEEIEEQDLYDLAVIMPTIIVKNEYERTKDRNAKKILKIVLNEKEEINNLI